jgi:hypothetical protein
MLFHLFRPMNTRRNQAATTQVFALSLAAILCALTTATADVINITIDNSGSLRNGVGVATKDEYGLNNNDSTSNLSFLNAEIGYYNAHFNPDLPAAVGPVGASFNSLNGGTSYTSIGGYDYLVIHYGTGQAQFAPASAWVPEVVVPPTYFTSGKKKGEIKEAGYTIPGHFADPQWSKSAGGWWAAFYIGGLEGVTFTVPTPGPAYDGLIYNGQPVGGFSSARYFNLHNVPDSGATLSLLGFGMMTLAFVARRIRS